MDYEIELTAKTTDDGGFVGSFTRQLAELGGEATLLSERAPYRVETSDGFYFEARRTYRIVQ